MSTSLSNTDQQLISAIKNGSYSAFERVFKTHYEALCRFALGFLRDGDASEELVQQVFYSYWEKHESINIQTSVKAYLYQAVRNASLNALKHETVKLAAQVELTRDEEIDAHYQVEQDEMALQIEKAIAKMPTERQKIFRMSRFEELKYREIADELKISVKTVENQMGKALKYLREELMHLMPLYIGWIIFFLIDQWG